MAGGGHSVGVNNIGWRASSGMVVVFDKAQNNRILSIKQAHSSNVDIGLATTGYAAGYKVARGSHAATVSMAITTGLTTIVAFATGIESKRATTANYCVLTTGKASGGTLTLYNWKHKTATASTLIAATSSATINWIAVGT